MRRRFLLFCAMWTASVLSLGAAVGACSAQHDASTSATRVDASSPSIQQFKEMTIPRGTTLRFALDDSVGSATSRVDQPVRGHLTRPVVVGGAPIVHAGSEVAGTVVDAKPSQRVEGRAELGIRFDMLSDRGETYSIHTPAIVRTAASEMKTETVMVVIPAAAGAVLGGVLGGSKGAVIGGVVGSGAGVSYVMSRRNPDIVLRAGTPLTVKLLEPLTVRFRQSS